MKLGKLISLLSGVALMATAVPAFATSSGSFSAASLDASCTINSSSGAYNVGSNSTGTIGKVWNINALPITLDVSSGSGTALLIRPSLVTGLFTDNKLSNTGASTEDIGVQVQVSVTGPNASAGVQIAPANALGDSGNLTDTGATCNAPAGGVASCVIYDQRFIQISSTVLQGLAACTAGSTCFEMIENTLSAHSFDFYVNVPTTGQYTVNVTAQLFEGINNSANGSVAACAGPGTVTVEQVKNFSSSSPLVF
jgi:hypothetical protein